MPVGRKTGVITTIGYGGHAIARIRGIRRITATPLTIKAENWW
jgi:hypothetical protein